VRPPTGWPPPAFAWIEAGGSEGVVLVIDGKRFPRFSVIARAGRILA
jgi:hypothetical protein